MKRRRLYLAIAASVIPLGLISRSFRGDFDQTSLLGFIAAYLPDTLWAVMFFFLFAAVLVRWRTWAIAALTLAFTGCIEASQLIEAEPLATLRSFAPIRFLLGQQFLWSDVVCLCVGTALTAMVHASIRYNRSNERNLKI